MSFNTILLKGDTREFQEKIAAGVITPGMLIELTSGDEVQANSTAADASPGAFFAMEDSLQGREITAAYSIGEIVKYISTVPSEEVYPIANAAIAVGDKVESAGNGKLQVLTTGKAIGIAKTAAGALDDRFVLERI